MAKRAKIIINEDGTTDIDLIEGFSGGSCAETSKQIELILGGGQITQKEKPEFYENEQDASVQLGIDLKY